MNPQLFIQVIVRSAICKSMSGVVELLETKFTEWPKNIRAVLGNGKGGLLPHKISSETILRNIIHPEHVF